MTFGILISNIGKPQEFVMVYGADGVKRKAEFHSEADATEACRIIEIMRIDTAFDGTVVKAI